MSSNLGKAQVGIEQKDDVAVLPLADADVAVGQVHLDRNLGMLGNPGEVYSPMSNGRVCHSNVHIKRACGLEGTGPG